MRVDAGLLICRSLVCCHIYESIINLCWSGRFLLDCVIRFAVSHTWLISCVTYVETSLFGKHVYRTLSGNLVDLDRW